MQKDAHVIYTRVTFALLCQCGAGAGAPAPHWCDRALGSGSAGANPLGSAVGMACAVPRRAWPGTASLCGLREPALALTRIYRRLWNHTELKRPVGSLRSKLQRRVLRGLQRLSYGHEPLSTGVRIAPRNNSNGTAHVKRFCTHRRAASCGHDGKWSTLGVVFTVTDSPSCSTRNHCSS
jgi:hypothetical protein